MPTSRHAQALGLTLALVCPNVISLAEEPPFQVRGHSWGETTEEVKAKEDGVAIEQQIQSSKMFLYLNHEILFDEQFHVGFSFFEGKLFGISYIYPGDKKCATLTEFLDQLVTELSIKYGSPAEKEVHKPCVRHIRWMTGDNQIKFDSEVKALDEIQFGITYRHMPTVEKVRQADKSRSKSKL